MNLQEIQQLFQAKSYREKRFSTALRPITHNGFQDLMGDVLAFTQERTAATNRPGQRPGDPDRRDQSISAGIGLSTKRPPQSSYHGQGAATCRYY